MKNFAILAGPDDQRLRILRHRRASRKSGRRRCKWVVDNPVQGDVPAAGAGASRRPRRQPARKRSPRSLPPPPRSANTWRSRRTSRSSRRSARKTTPTGSTAGNERRRQPRAEPVPRGGFASPRGRRATSVGAEQATTSARRRRQGPAAARGHAPARPPARRRAARADRRGGLRAHRGDPPDRRPLPPRRRRRRARGQQELVALLNDLPIAQTLDVVRAFSYFSHLVNIAEDVHQNRRRRSHALAGSPPQRGSLADALECVAGARHRRRERSPRGSPTRW